jgi:hypothetical protein
LPEAAQSILILDWDDTIFPTTLLFDHWGLSSCPEEWSDLRLTNRQQEELDSYSAALMVYLRCCCNACESCVIITNARQGWVHECVNTFVPEMRDLLDEGAVRVIYAREGRRASKSMRPVSYVHKSYGMSPDEVQAHFTSTKTLAMKNEVKRFRSTHPGPTTKNILSVGDAEYEFFALQEVALTVDAAPGETLRFKALRLDTPLSLPFLAMRLKMDAWILRSFLSLDADIAMDLVSKPKAGRFNTLMSMLGLPKYVGKMDPFCDECSMAEAIVYLQNHFCSLSGVFGGT